MGDVDDVSYVIICIEIIVVVIHVVVSHYNDFLFLIVGLLPSVYDLLPSGCLILCGVTMLNI